jgi:hypothetical protein
MEDYWLKQTSSKPLFEDLIWSKPENKTHAGKLLIIGGSTNGFAHTVSCFSEAQKAGAGVVKVVIPESIKKIIGYANEDIIYGQATKSGGFSQEALGLFIETSEWSDAVLLSGELANNSETSILFEKFIEKYNDALIIAGDAFDFTNHFWSKLLKNNKVTFVLDFNRLQKLSMISGLTKPITSTTTLVNLVENLHEMTELTHANLIIEYSDFIIVASQGYVSTTKIENKNNLQIKLAANAAIWYMQNINKTFEALSCAAITCQN